MTKAFFIDDILALMGKIDFLIQIVCTVHDVSLPVYCGYTTMYRTRKQLQKNTRCLLNRPPKYLIRVYRISLFTKKCVTCRIATGWLRFHVILWTDVQLTSRERFPYWKICLLVEKNVFSSWCF